MCVGKAILTPTPARVKDFQLNLFVIWLFDPEGIVSGDMIVAEVEQYPSRATRDGVLPVISRHHKPERVRAPEKYARKGVRL